LNTNNARKKLKKLQRRGRVKNDKAILGCVRKETKRTMKENKKKTTNEEWRKGRVSYDRRTGKKN
jgi:hypothetical protein